METEPIAFKRKTSTDQLGTDAPRAEETSVARLDGSGDVSERRWQLEAACREREAALFFAPDVALPAPWPLAACPCTFGNTDAWAATTG